MSTLARLGGLRRKLVSTGILGLLLGINFGLWGALYLSGSWLLGSLSSIVMAAVP